MSREWFEILALAMILGIFASMGWFTFEWAVESFQRWRIRRARRARVMRAIRLAR